MAAKGEPRGSLEIILWRFFTATLDDTVLEKNSKSRLPKRLPPKNLIYSSKRSCDGNLFIWSKPRQRFNIFCPYIILSREITGHAAAYYK